MALGGTGVPPTHSPAPRPGTGPHPTTHGDTEASEAKGRQFEVIYSGGQARNRLPELDPKIRD